MVCPLQQATKGIFLGFNSIQAGANDNNIFQRRINQRPGLKPHHTGLNVQPHFTLLENPAS